VFGTILTRLRTRLGNKALVTLAELKLYLREEHLQAHAVKKQLKRSFGASFNDDAPANAMPVVIGESTVSEASDGPAIEGIIHTLVHAAEADEDPPPTPVSQASHMPIADLFDFTQSYWVEGHEKLGM
jgi:hypothetical protein